MRTCSTCSLVVVEPESHWGPVLRGAFEGRGLRVAECRSLAACESWLTSFPWSVVALYATPENSASVVRFLRGLRQRPEQIWGVGLVPAEAIELEPLLREAGAVDVLCTVLHADRLVRLVLRQAARAPRQRCAEETWITAQLPWEAEEGAGPGGV